MSKRIENNYTRDGEIVRGSRWPAVGSLRINLVCSQGWPAGATSYSWRMRFSRKRRGGDDDVTVIAQNATFVDAETLQLEFVATQGQTAALPGVGSMTFNVDILSLDPTTTTTTPAPGEPALPDYRFYSAASGYAFVIDKTGDPS